MGFSLQKVHFLVTSLISKYVFANTLLYHLVEFQLNMLGCILWLIIILSVHVES